VVICYGSHVAARQTKRLDVEGLMNYALRALGSRALSMGELRDKLRRRAEHAGDVDEVVRRLRESGYLDDRRYAENYASARLENEGLGRTRVLRDLRQRRVAPALAEQAVNRAFRETDESQLIEAYLQRKFRGKDLRTWLAEENNLASAYRRLRYAGFSSGNSIRMLKRYAERAEELEEGEPESE
jgi:regulatory protein